MPLQFPVNPTLNQLYQSGSSSTYVWNGSHWQVSAPAQTGLSVLTASYSERVAWIQPTPPPTSTGSMWYDIDTGNTYIRYDSAWVPVQSNTVNATSASYALSLTSSLRQDLTLSGSILISGSLLVNGAAPAGGGGATVTISGSIPSGQPASGSLWWNDNNGNLYIQVASPTGSTYVPASTTIATSTSASFASSASNAISASFATSASVATAITTTSGSGLWVWSMGNPTGSGWTLAGSTTYSHTPAGGIVLTPDATLQTGIAYRSLSTAYFTNNDFVMTINAKASGSTGTTQGGDGIAMYMGAANNIGGAYDGLTIYLDEYHTANDTTDALKINVNNSQFAAVDLASFTGFLDNNTWRKLTAVVTGPSPNRILTVLINDIIVWRGEITWTPTGGNYGIWGFTGGARNHHAVNMVNLQPAKMWMMSNGLL